MTELTHHQKYLQEYHHSYNIPEKHIEYLRNLKAAGFEPRVIYDIGANVLHWTKNAEKIWPDAKIILFEAYQPCEFLYKNYDHFMGVLSKSDNDTVKFYQSEAYPGGNSYYKENSDVFGEFNYAMMPTRTLDSVVKDHNFPLPDFIKIDVQGSEKDILLGAKQTIRYASRMIVELQHVEYNLGAPKCDETLPFIEGLGWKCTDPLFQNNGPDGDYGFVNASPASSIPSSEFMADRMGIRYFRS
jgi:FkbM family methyltransferase